MRTFRYFIAVYLMEKATRFLQESIKLRMEYLIPGSNMVEIADLLEAFAELWMAMAMGVYPEWPTEPPRWDFRWVKMAAILVGLGLLLGGSRYPEPVRLLECRSPWIVMSPGLETAMEARVNLDQDGTWVIQAPRWLVILDPDRAVATHDLDAWEVEVNLATSYDSEICGYINVVMGERLIIPEYNGAVDF